MVQGAGPFHYQSCPGHMLLVLQVIMEMLMFKLMKLSSLRTLSLGVKKKQRGRCRDAKKALKRLCTDM